MAPNFARVEGKMFQGVPRRMRFVRHGGPWRPLRPAAVRDTANVSAAFESMDMHIGRPRLRLIFNTRNVTCN